MRTFVIIILLSFSIFGFNCPVMCAEEAWFQAGYDIDGEAAGDHSGSSISLSADGSIVAIGAPYNGDAGDHAGHVRVYQNVSSVYGIWTQIGDDIDGEGTRDYSGMSVSLSADGSVVAIGAPRYDGVVDPIGHVRVYQNISGTWAQVGDDIDGEAVGDISGSCVRLSADGSIVAIGAPYNDDAGDHAGHVRVYQNVSGNWTQVGDDIDGEEIGDYSGSSVSLSADGSIVAIEAPYNDISGHVRVFQNDSGIWTQVGDDINGAAGLDNSGSSVSLSADGSVVAIGAPYNSDAGNEAGHVRVYKNISGTWDQIGDDIDGKAAGDKSGGSVSLSADGSVVAVGAIYSDGNGIGDRAGHVRVFKRMLHGNNEDSPWIMFLSAIINRVRN